MKTLTRTAILSLVVMLLLSAVSYADRPQCPSTRNGVCFIEFEGVPQASAMFTQEGDAVGVLWEGTTDEVFRFLPDGTMVWHGSGGPPQFLFACRGEDGGIDCVIDWFYGGSPAGIMLGEGHGAWNINWDCEPFMTSILGTVTDNAGQVFEVTGHQMRKPDPAGGPDCLSLVDRIDFRLQRD